MTKEQDTGLVTAKEVAKAINVDKYGVLGTFFGWGLMKVLKISTLNRFYKRNKHLNDGEFLDAILDDFKPEKQTQASRQLTWARFRNGSNCHFSSLTF